MFLYFLWLALVISSFIGWGVLMSRALRIDDVLRSASDHAVLGIFLLSGIGATCALLGGGSPRTWTLLLTVGSAIWVIHALPLVRDALRSATRSIGRWVVSGFVFAGAVVFSVSNAMTRPWNPCDDDPSYLYLAQRFWIVGDIHEPFNNRRLTSPGLFTFVQAMLMGPFKEGTLHIADEVLGGVMILLALWRHRRTSRIHVAGIITAFVIILSHQYFGAANSSPTMFVAAILIAGIPPVSGRHHDKIALSRYGVIFGASASILVLTRPYMLLVVVSVGLAYCVLSSDFVMPRFMIPVVLTGSIGSAPWAILGIRDVRTPLFPLFRGNLASNFPFDGYTWAVKISKTLVDTAQGLASSIWPTAVVLALLALFALSRSGGTHGSASVRTTLFSLVVVLGLIAYYFYFAVSVRRTGPTVWFPRFWAPSLAFPVLLAVLYSRDNYEKSELKHSLVALTAPVVLFAPTLNGVWSQVSTTNRIAFSGTLSDAVSKGRYGSSAVQYRSVAQAIPSGARVLAAVQLPHLLLRPDIALESLDLAGSTVEKDLFPFFKTFSEKEKWLSRQGFGYVVTTHSDSQSCLFGLSSWKSNFGRNNTYSDWMLYVIDWIQFADHLATRTNQVTATAGDISLIRVQTK